MLHISSEHTEDENSFLQRTAIFLLNSMASQVDTSHKLVLGSLGAMECMMSIATLKIQEKVEKLTEWKWILMIHCRCVMMFWSLCGPQCGI